MYRRAAIVCPSHLGQQLVPCWESSAQVSLRELDEHRRQWLLDLLEIGHRQRFETRPNRHTEQSVQSLIAALLV